MSTTTVTYLLASASLFAAERIFGGNDVVRWALVALGGLLLLVTLGWRMRTIEDNPTGTKLAVGAYALSASSVIFYVLSQRDIIGNFGLEPDTQKQAQVALQALTALVWALGFFPAAALDRTLTASPKSPHPLRSRAALEGGLSVALGLSMLFPLNYLADNHDKKWDYGFFKTTEVGTATQQIVDALTEPIKIVLFYPPSSDVRRELLPYFEEMVGPNISLETMDAVMDPEAAKQWKVRDNGTIAFIKGEGTEDERVETLKIADKIDTARKDLRKLDSKVQTSLLKLVREKRTIYATVGHGELYWKNAPTEDENIDNMKKVLEALNFKVKELGVDDGLAQAVPDDAGVVLIPAPTAPFLPEEIAALKEYRDRGGAFFVMLRPTETPDPELAALFGVTFDSGLLLSDKAFLERKKGLTDRAYIVTNKFSSHESVTTLSKNSSRAYFIAPMSGAIDEVKDGPGKVQITIKSMADWFVDLNGNYEFDKDTEKRGGHDIAAVVTGPAANNSEWRAAVIAGGSWASNPLFNAQAMTQGIGNMVYLGDTMGWLTKDPALGGETESEEDVKIQHTKEGQAMWFYGITAGVPAMLMLIGLVRVNSRKKKGAA